MLMKLPFRRVAQAFCLIVFLYVLFSGGWSDRADATRENNLLSGPLGLFLRLDPLVGISTTLAARAMSWSLVTAGAVLLIGMVFPRWFCGYICPLGTLIDMTDWSINRHIKRFRLKSETRWFYLRFHLLVGILTAAVFGVLVSGFAAAIPVLTRGIVSLAAPLQDGLFSGRASAVALTGGQIASIVIFVGILALGLLRPRFWCAYLCPSGALLGLAGRLSLFRRRVEPSCINCGRCLRQCSFNAIAPDYSTRDMNCTVCRNCEAVCPKQAFRFGWRWNRKQKASGDPTTTASLNSRRLFLLSLIGTAGTGAAAAAGIRWERGRYTNTFPIRPPGSLPEARFRAQCVRCGECLKICPSRVLQPSGLELGLDGLWTPTIKADIAGCQSSCTNCGQVCPTGAIRNLPLEEKRAARIGLAQVNETTCLPHAEKDVCGLCYEACAAAGYHAIEYRRIGIQYDNRNRPIADSGFLAPVVLEEKCVGCGLCQASCYAANVKESELLEKAAIQITAGTGREDRIISGSYIELRNERTRLRQPNPPAQIDNEYLPDFLQ